jgi:5'-phosphate synthase pdxT subunit
MVGLSSGRKPLVGVLALQGDYAAHKASLLEAGADVVEVRSGEELAAVQAMVIPGGESTVMASLMERFGFLEEFRRRILSGMPVFGTCAGLILLAARVEKWNRQSLAVLDIDLRRNAYGTQVDSFRTPLKTKIPGISDIEAVFIRAPKILSCGPEVEVLASHEGDPVLVRQGSILGASFHPELVPGALVHRWFLDNF